MAIGFLQRERIVAPPGWSRWLIPPAALSIHLSIGQAYAWSVFKPPLEAGMHISGVASALPFTFGIIMLGLSAAVFGTKVDANGPRWAMAVASACFVSGFLMISIQNSPGASTGDVLQTSIRHSQPSSMTKACVKVSIAAQLWRNPTLFHSLFEIFQCAC